MNRIEDARLLCGRGRYSGDINAPGQGHACFLRSPHAHARIVGVNADAARAFPGVALVLLGADCAQLAWPPCFVRFPGKDGGQILQPRRPMLAAEAVKFVGEPVALVVADTAAKAQDAAELIEVVYEPLPAVVDAAAAVCAGAPRLYDEIPQNVCFEFETGSDPAVQAAIAGAPHVARVELFSQRVVANPLEPRACLAQFENGVCTLHTPTQGVSMMRGHIATMLGMDPARLRVVAQDVGGGFGARSTGEPELAVLALAAQRLGRPVKWTGTRSEGFLADPQGRDNRIQAELALDRDGNFLALRYSFLSNLGAYLTPIGAMVHALNPSICGSGVYRIPALYGHFRQVLTNTAPVGPYRGAGRPDTSYFIERVVQEAAHRFGFDPVALRHRNLIPREAFPYRTANGYVYDVGDFSGVLDGALALADWDGFPERRRSALRRGKLRGIGLASFVESSGGGVAPEDQATIRIKGGQLCLEVSTQSNGQGHETVFSELLARELGVAREVVRFAQSDPDDSPMGSGSFGSRSLMMTGSAIVLAARKLLEQARPRAAAELSADAGSLDFAAGAFRDPTSGREVSLLDLVARHASVPHPFDATAGMALHRAYPNGCHVAEVEIDPDTGETRIERYSACDDFGNVLNHAAVEGQLHGGIAQGAGQALLENCAYDPDSAQLLTGSFMDYAMPRADLMSAPRSIEHPVPCPGNPLGAKGAGEAGTTGALPALANAVLDALRPRGVQHLDFPFTPERVWQAIRQQETKQ